MVACDGRWRPPAAVTVCGLNCMAVAPTGARVISQALYELQRRGGGLALTTACAAGGIGAAMVLEAE